MTADELLRQQEEARSQSPTRFPRAGVSEVSGPLGGGKTEWVVRKLASASSPGRIAWLEESLTIYPCALEQAGLALNRLYFIEAGGALLACAHQAARSGLFESVVVSRSAAKDWEERAWRRLQLVAESSQASLVVVSEEATRAGAWTLALQVEVQREAGGRPHPQIKKGAKAWVRGAG